MVDSLDTLRLRTRSASELRMTSPAGTDESGIIRNVPGWQISYPLFDRLAGLYAFYSRQPPAFIGATRSPGFEYLVDGDQNIECKFCAATRQLTAGLLFLKTSQAASLVDSIWQGFLGPEDEIILRRRLPPSFDNQLNLAGPRKVPINALWWKLADTELKSELSSTCGCCNHPPES